MLDPKIRSATGVLAYGGGSFLLSGVALGGAPQPLAAGLICSGSGWRSAAMCLGAMIGYPVFWRMDGRQGMVWAATTGILALMLGQHEQTREQPLMIPIITAFLTALTGAVFFLFLREETQLDLFLFRVAVSFGAGVLFTQHFRQKDAVTRWLVGGIAVLTLAQIAPVPWLRLGYVAAGVIGILGAFPAAVVAGLGLDLAQVTHVPMTAVLSAAGLIRMIPFDKKWQHYASAGFGCLAVMAACGTWDITPLPGLLLGGGIAAVLPPQPGAVPRRGETGAAQVRLELGAAVMEQTFHLLAESPLPGLDQEAIFRRALDRACTDCSARKNCATHSQLTAQVLADPCAASCRKQGRLRSELYRAQDQLRYLQRDKRRRSSETG